MLSRIIPLLVLSVLFTCGGVLQAHAEGSGTLDDPYVLEDGGTYDIVANTDFYGVFTAPADGRLSLTNTNFAVYTDNTYKTQSDIVSIFNGNYSNKAYHIDCTAGTTYWIKAREFGSVTTTVTFGSGAPDLELLKVSPEGGTVFDVGNGQVGLEFNEAMTATHATMSAGKASDVSITMNMTNAYLSVDVKEKLMELYNAGSVTEGDDIKFTFYGLAPAADPAKLYNGTGVLVLTYKASAKPLVLVNAWHTPDGEEPAKTFYSYYMKNDPMGVVKFEFSDELNTEQMPSATLIYGNSEAESAAEFYSEQLDVDVQGNTLTVDLRNKLRRAVDMMESGMNYGSIRLRVANVRDKNGNYAYAVGSGVQGSFDFMYGFEDVKYTVVSDWTVDGKPDFTYNKDTKNVELWMREIGGQAVFDGLQISYARDGEPQSRLFTLDQLAMETEGEEKTITIPVEGIEADNEIVISLTGVERPDGLTVDKDPSAMDPFTLTLLCQLNIISAVWHNGTEDVNMIDSNIGVLTAKTTTTITTNKDSEIGYAVWELRDKSDPVNGYVRSGYLTGPTDEGFTISWYGEALAAGKDYTFTLKTWKTEEDSRTVDPNLGEVSFVIHGAKEAYVYSDVTLNTDISSPFVMASADDNVLSLEFSAPVTLTAVVNLGSGLSADCTVEKTDADGKVWAVTMPQDAIDVNVFAKDSEGRAVNKTANGLGTIMGNEANTWFEIHVSAEYNKPDLTVEPADGSELESIETITFSYEGGIMCNWGATTTPITIYNRSTRQPVATFTQDDVVEIGGESFFDPIVSCYVQLKTPITEAGTYTVEIPSGFFILGEQMMAPSSKATSVTYVVKGSATPTAVTIDPTAGNVTEIPAMLVVTFNDCETVTNLNDPTLVDANGKTYPVSFEWGDGLNQLNVILKDGAITATGTYTLTIPAGAVELGDVDKVNTEDIVFVYIIGTADAIKTLAGEEDGRVTVYGINGTLLLRDADAAALKTLGKGLYIINGKKAIVR